MTNDNNNSRNVVRIISVKLSRRMWVLFGGDDPDVSARLKIIFYYTYKNLLLFITIIYIPDTLDGLIINMRRSRLQRLYVASIFQKTPYLPSWLLVYIGNYIMSVDRFLLKYKNASNFSNMRCIEYVDLWWNVKRTKTVKNKYIKQNISIPTRNFLYKIK